MVRVRIDVKSEDVYLIVEFVDGKQTELFFDPETMASRKTPFIRETHQWFAQANARRLASRESK